MKVFLLEREERVSVKSPFIVIGVILVENQEGWNEAAQIACNQRGLEVVKNHPCPHLQKLKEPYVYRLREVPLINLPG